MTFSPKEYKLLSSLKLNIFFLKKVNKTKPGRKTTCKTAKKQRVL